VQCSEDAESHSKSNNTNGDAKVIIQRNDSDVTVSLLPDNGNNNIPCT